MCDAAILRDTRATGGPVLAGISRANPHSHRPLSADSELEQSIYVRQHRSWAVPIFCVIQVTRSAFGPRATK